MEKSAFSPFMYAFLQLIHVFLLWFFTQLQPYLTPICFVVAWSLVILGGWQLIAATRDSLSQAQTMHQIPCADCRFFTNSHHLKCPVHPSQAMTRAAIGCGDFETANAVHAAIQRQEAERAV
ncbi:MAG: hypothetical protein AAFN18_09065 [Cyanobacteria bacterium J06554_6]